MLFQSDKEMQERDEMPEWMGKTARIGGRPDRLVRFEKAAKEIARAIVMNRPKERGGGCRPVVVEGIRDENAVRALGFTGPVEKVNRGWDRSRLVAYLHKTYAVEETNKGSRVILLMDWDRTGGRLQTSIRDRLMALDVKVDEELRNTLLRTLKPEGRTVESLLPHVSTLVPLVQSFLSEM